MADETLLYRADSSSSSKQIFSPASTSDPAAVLDMCMQFRIATSSKRRGLPVRMQRYYRRVFPKWNYSTFTQLRFGSPSIFTLSTHLTDPRKPLNNILTLIQTLITNIPYTCCFSMIYRRLWQQPPSVKAPTRHQPSLVADLDMYRNIVKTWRPHRCSAD